MLQTQRKRVDPFGLFLALTLLGVAPGSPGAPPAQESAAVIAQRASMQRLHNAVRSGDREAVLAILASGVEVNQTEALRLAVLARRVDLVDLLLAQGADIDRAGLQGEPPALTAFRDGRIDMMKHLIDKGADINRPDTRGRTLLQHATRRGGDPKLIDYLRAHGARPGVERRRP